MSRSEIERLVSKLNPESVFSDNSFICSNKPLQQIPSVFMGYDPV